MTIAILIPLTGRSPCRQRRRSLRPRPLLVPASGSCRSNKSCRSSWRRCWSSCSRCPWLSPSARWHDRPGRGGVLQGCGREGFRHTATPSGARRIPTARTRLANRRAQPWTPQYSPQRGPPWIAWPPPPIRAANRALECGRTPPATPWQRLAVRDWSGTAVDSVPGEGLRVHAHPASLHATRVADTAL